MEEIESLKEKIYQAFPKSAPPAADNIALHPCDECEETRAAFENRNWWELSFELIKKMYDKLPLLTPEAFHYFFPGYLLRALEDFVTHSSINEFLVYSWEIDERADYFESYKDRLALFSPPQMEVVKKYLQLVAGSEEMASEHKLADKGLALLDKTAAAIRSDKR